MSEKERLIEYELHIEDMLKAIKERLDEFEEPRNMSVFEQGRQTAYMEMLDIIETRHKMICEIVN